MNENIIQALNDFDEDIRLEAANEANQVTDLIEELEITLE